MIVGTKTHIASDICNIISGKQHLPTKEAADAIYTTYVKPLEDALAKAEADKDDIIDIIISILDGQEWRNARFLSSQALKLIDDIAKVETQGT